MLSKIPLSYDFMKLLKNKKMKKNILFVFLVIFSLSAFAITPDSKTKSENTPFSNKKEYKMSQEEMNSLTKLNEEMSMDKMKQTIVVREGRGNRRGHRGPMNRDNRRNGGVVFVGGGAAILLIILILILI